MTLQKKGIYTEPWVIMFQPALLRLANARKLSGSDFRVFFMLLSKTEMKNWIKVQQSALAREMGLTRATVCRAFKNLCELGVIEPKRLEGTKIVDYRLSLSVGWRGTVHDYYAERAKSRKEGGDPTSQDPEGQMVEHADIYSDPDNGSQLH